VIPVALSERMEKLKTRLFESEYHNPGVWHFQDVNILDEWPEISHEPIVVRKGYAQKYIGERLPAIIKDDELIVGNPNQNSVGWGTVLPIYYTEEEGEQAARYQLNEASVWGHHPPDWSKILKMGTSGVRLRIVDEIERRTADGEPDALALDEYKAMLVALEGLETFGKRHAMAALDLAYRCCDPVRKAELLEMYRVCSHVPVNPARTFREAVQAYWFAYCMINSGGEYVPLGRMDQFIYPYYSADTDAGALSKEEARDILASFLVKCNERVVQDTKLAENHYNFGLFSQGTVPDENNMNSGTNRTGGFAARALTWQEDESVDSEANFNYGQSGNDWLMNCIVAGQHEDGSDATTELSYMFVEIMHEMGLLMPTLAVRIHKDTPPEFIDKVAEVLRCGQGEPIIYNDESIIPGFVDLGIPVEAARDYSNDGCWETLIQGKSHFSYAHVLNIRAVEWVFTRGVSPYNGVREGLDTGDPEDLTTFADFYEAYRKQTNYCIDRQCKTRLENYGLSYMIAPDPLMSSIMDDCVAKGRDISQDGARYVFHQILATGLSAAVDSLMVVKELVYEKKAVTPSEFRDILAADWEGRDALRATAVNKVPKFGNDVDAVDDLAVRLLKDFADHVTEWNDKHTRIRFVSGIGTFENYAALGRDIGATPDGRHRGDALAPNYSPMPGVDVNGPTAAIKSAAKADLLRYYSGTPLDLSVNSREVEGEAGIVRLAGLIKAFCDLGGNILTITGANAEDLEDAKIHPERHKSLRIRMGGLSAYFIAMSPVQQDNIIKRFRR
jgi:formate C-acetyltransferase